MIKFLALLYFHGEEATLTVLLQAQKARGEESFIEMLKETSSSMQMLTVFHHTTVSLWLALPSWLV